jgi:hypothetical protein
LEDRGVFESSREKGAEHVGICVWVDLLLCESQRNSHGIDRVSDVPSCHRDA